MFSILEIGIIPLINKHKHTEWKATKIIGIVYIKYNWLGFQSQGKIYLIFQNTEENKKQRLSLIQDQHLFFLIMISTSNGIHLWQIIVIKIRKNAILIFLKSAIHSMISQIKKHSMSHFQVSFYTYKMNLLNYFLKIIFINPINPPLIKQPFVSG